MRRGKRKRPHRLLCSGEHIRRVGHARGQVHSHHAVGHGGASGCPCVRDVGPLDWQAAPDDVLLGGQHGVLRPGGGLRSMARPGCVQLATHGPAGVCSLPLSHVYPPVAMDTHRRGTLVPVVRLTLVRTGK